MEQQVTEGAVAMLAVKNDPTHVANHLAVPYDFV